MSGGGAAAGKAVFVSHGCGACHTLQAAKSTGKVGPDLDKLPDYAQQAGMPLEQFVRESIVDPDAYVEKGFPPNVMPPTFTSLPKDQLDALVKFLVDSRRGRSDGRRDQRARGARRARAAPPPTGLRRFTAPGWLRVLWMMPLFWGIGAGIVLLLRWYAGWDPLWEWNAIVVVAFLTTMPIGFLAGLGAFDYWVHYALGGETRPEDHSATARAAGRTTSASTPTTR